MTERGRKHRCRISVTVQVETTPARPAALTPVLLGLLTLYVRRPPAPGGGRHTVAQVGTDGMPCPADTCPRAESSMDLEIGVISRSRAAPAAGP